MIKALLVPCDGLNVPNPESAAVTEATEAAADTIADEAGAEAAAEAANAALISGLLLLCGGLLALPSPKPNGPANPGGAEAESS